MTLRDFFSQYDTQEGDLLECENGEVYEMQLNSVFEHNHVCLRGPKPSHDLFAISTLECVPKRILRPRWKGLGPSGVYDDEYYVYFEVLQPKQPAQKKPTITVNVPKGFDCNVEVKFDADVKVGEE